MGTVRAGNKLSERDGAILAFEEEHSRADGAKEEAIRSRFSLSAARYYQLLNILIDDPAALAARPMLVHRLREQRARRVAARLSRGYKRSGGPL